MWKVGQEAVYVFGHYGSDASKVKYKNVPIIITCVMAEQVHAHHKYRAREIRFIPHDRLRPVGYNLTNGEDKTTEKETTTQAQQPGKRARKN